jgi:hypothetical protein
MVNMVTEKIYSSADTNPISHLPVAFPTEPFCSQGSIEACSHQRSHWSLDLVPKKEKFDGKSAIPVYGWLF